MLLLGIIVTASLYSFVRHDNGMRKENAQTERALALAKDALIGYASARPTDKTDRPGELPCPDMNNNGQSDDGQCDTVATQIGRFPWVTLRTEDLRDASGERLWYAVSNDFRDNPPVIPLNSNTLGQLTVTGIAPANNVIAIIFAPGSVVAGQNRSVANVNDIAQYLEGNNANGDTTFIASAPSNTFNDKLLAITPSMFFPAVEMKAARELRSTLNSYFTIHRYFPPASAFDASCASPNQGMILTNPAICKLGHSTWTPQPWLLSNQWERLLFYAVAPACADPLALDCTGAGGFLGVNGASGVRALVIAPGKPYPGQARPCASISDCLEPPNATSFPTFTHTTGSATSNDRVVIVAP
jgi:type II secretory pathway pseudopilin PulG